MKVESLVIAGCMVVFMLACEENDEWEDSMDAGSLQQGLTSGCVRFFDEEIENGGDGLTWGTAFNDLQTAIDSAELAAGAEGSCEVRVNEEELDGPIGDQLEIPSSVKIMSGQAREEMGSSTARASSDSSESSLASASQSETPFHLPPTHDIETLLYAPSATPYANCGSCTGTGTISGRLELINGIDASGSANSGYLEIGNDLRIDNNEIITDTNSTLYLQNDNNGDLRVDNNTLVVDSSTNRVGIGTKSPSAKLDIRDSDNADFAGVKIQAYGSYVWDWIGLKLDPSTSSNSSGKNHAAIEVQDDNHFIWALPYQDSHDFYQWGIFWAGNSNANPSFHSGENSSNPNEIAFIGNGRLKASINLNSGNSYFKKLYTTEVVVRSGRPWPDYVFEEDYNLMSLVDVEDYIAKNKHLPEIPSASDVAETGIVVAENQTKLLKKIEELTLYLIDQNKKIESQNSRLAELEAYIAKNN
ncbi:MAG: hypothetical protein GY854_08945 [Deltaproteobacteria bacterium]|nr:hypothetical protein [Deltaproteobacteria bacterium]